MVLFCVWFCYPRHIELALSEYGTFEKYLELSF